MSWEVVYRDDTLVIERGTKTGEVQCYEPTRSAPTMAAPRHVGEQDGRPVGLYLVFSGRAESLRWAKVAYDLVTQGQGLEERT